MNNNHTINNTALAQWVFPASTKYPPRPYQMQICEKALFTNTLVCLPTGMGKTLIAAVVIYNFYKWFPKGVIIFMAPTKPLVDQQISACVDIVGLTDSDTVQLTGTVSTEDRENLWKEKRVFFCTPQTLSNDLTNKLCDPQRVVCLIIDEAHKATANYAFTVAVEQISSVNSNFRILALSATPGTNARDIQNVIRNLHISHIEMRCEDDREIAMYRHHRLVETIICDYNPNAGTNFIRDQLNELIRIPLMLLHSNGIIGCNNPQNLNIFVIQEAEKALLREEAVDPLPLDLEIQMKGLIEEIKCLLNCRKVLFNDGEGSLLSALNKMNDCSADSPKGSAVRSPLFSRLLQSLRYGKSDRMTKAQSKIVHLQEVLCEHFQRHRKVNSSTRSLIFCNTRETVDEIVSVLEKLPYIKAHAFVGQGTRKITTKEESASKVRKGLKQTEQIEVLKLFNEGAINVLVATSVAEEGLDIAEVDLIIFFDVVSSPIRQVQREGRTARKRSGRVVVLASNKAEADKIEKTSEHSASISKALKNASTSMRLFPNSPRMIPSHLPLPAMQTMDLSRNRDRVSLSGKENSSAPISSKKNVLRAEDSSSKISSFFQASVIAKNESNYNVPVKRAPLHEILTLNGKVSTGTKLLSTENKSSSSHSKMITNIVEDSSNRRIYGQKVEFSSSDTARQKQSEIFSPSYRHNSLKSSSPVAQNSQSGKRELFGWNFRPTLNDSGSTGSGSANTKRNLEAPKSSVQYFFPQSNSNVAPVITEKKREPSTSIIVAGKNTPLHNNIDTIDPFPKFTYSFDEPSQNESQSSSIKKASNIDQSGDISQLSSSTKHVIASLHLQNVRTSMSTNKSFYSDNSSSEENSPARNCNQRSSFKKLGGGNEDIDICIDYDYTPEIVNSKRRNRKAYSDDESEDDLVLPSLRVNNGIAELHEIERISNDDAKCAVCLDPEADDDDPIIFCDGSCNTCVHLSCYGLKKVPEGDFYCEPCEIETVALSRKAIRPKPPACVLCFRPGHLLKKSTCGKWVHALCVLFTPELQIDDVSKRAINLDCLSAQRKTLSCSICRRSGGACVQCAVDDCFEAFHPFCCFDARLQMVIRCVDKESNIYEIYCKKHKNCVTQPRTVTSSRNDIRIDSLASSPIDLSNEDDRGTTSITHQIKRQVTLSKPTIGKKRTREKHSKVSKFFEEEALEVVSDCGEESIDEAEVKRPRGDSSEEDEECDDEFESSFINDGEYTQPSDGGQALTQQALYLSLNRRQMELDSPDDAALVLADWKRKNRADKSFNDNDVSFLSDQRPQSTTELSFSVHGDEDDEEEKWWQNTQNVKDSSKYGIAEAFGKPRARKRLEPHKKKKNGLLCLSDSDSDA